MTFIHQAHDHMTAANNPKPVARSCPADQPHSRDDSQKVRAQTYRGRHVRPGPVPSPLPRKGRKPGARVASSRCSAPALVVRDVRAWCRRYVLSEENPHCRCLTTNVPGGPAPVTASSARYAPNGVWLGPSMGVGGTAAAMRSARCCPALLSAVSPTVPSRKRDIPADSATSGSRASLHGPTAVASTAALTGRTPGELTDSKHTWNPPSEESVFRAPLQADWSRLQGFELHESPYIHPSSVTPTIGADPLLGFHLPRVFALPALTTPIAQPPLTHLNVAGAEASASLVPQSLNEQEDWRISLETAYPSEVSVLVSSLPDGPMSLLLPKELDGATVAIWFGHRAPLSRFPFHSRPAGFRSGITSPEGSVIPPRRSTDWLRRSRRSAEVWHPHRWVRAPRPGPFERHPKVQLKPTRQWVLSPWVRPPPPGFFEHHPRVLPNLAWQ